MSHSPFGFEYKFVLVKQFELGRVERPVRAAICLAVGTAAFTDTRACLGGIGEVQQSRRAAGAALCEIGFRHRKFARLNEDGGEGPL